MSQITLGMIGCGGVANGHASRLNGIPEVTIGALVDISEDHLEAFSERHGLEEVPQYSDYRPMLEEVEPDAVLICTPHTLHYRQIMDALDAGCHVLTEKPMVCTTERAQKVVEAKNEKDKVVAVSYQRHFDPAYIYMRRAIASGKLGDVQYVAALQGQNWYRGTRGSWRQKKELSGGGQLNDSGSHLVDILLWITGLSVDEVGARIERFDSEVDINSTVSASLDNGALLSLSIIGNNPTWCEDFTITGSEGVFYYRNGDLSLHLQDDGEQKIKLPKVTSNPDQNFIDAILGRDKNRIPAECGLKVIRLTEAIWEAAGEGN